jgi:hypothetical protein
VRAFVPPSLHGGVHRPVTDHRASDPDIDQPVPFPLSDAAPPAAYPIDPSSLRVRPYLDAHEQEFRRSELALALHGVDVELWAVQDHSVGTLVPASAGVGAR